MKYPDGFSNTENVYNGNTTYTVPEGKNLYITSMGTIMISINFIALLIYFFL